MTCDSALPIFTIFLGDAKALNLAAIIDKFGGPLDLTSCTEIAVYLPNEDGSFLELLLSTGDVVINTPALLGRFSAAITALQSAKFNVGELQTFNVTFTIGASVFTVPYFNSLSVFEVQP